MGQDDCEKLGGIFYFRILWFNVGPFLDCMLLFSEDSMLCCAHMCAERGKPNISARCCNCTTLLGAFVTDPCLYPGFEYGWTWKCIGGIHHLG